jgi:hypothetical protein
LAVSFPSSGPFWPMWHPANWCPALLHLMLSIV